MSRSTIVPAFAFVLIASFFSACNPWGVEGTGEIVTDFPEVGSFHAITISVPARVEIYKGETCKVEVQIESSLLHLLHTDVKDGRLDVYFSKDVWEVDGLVLKITAPSIDDIELNGTVVLVSGDDLGGGNLQVHISGSGSATFGKITAKNLDLNISGSGNLQMSGTANYLNSVVSGSGNITALDCPVEKADIHISGSGSVSCQVIQTLDASISGSGDVLYSGDPSLKVDISGSGKVKKI